ncbi:MAG: hypothetical protein Rhims3KO_30800 [Hyphomicrobiales bacterium]
MANWLVLLLSARTPPVTQAVRMISVGKQMAEAIKRNEGVAGCCRAQCASLQRHIVLSFSLSALMAQGFA